MKFYNSIPAARSAGRKRKAKMLDLIHICGVSLVAFAATNADNAWLLIALLARADHHRLGVAAGFVAASLAVSALAWGASSGLELFPAHWIDFLGVVPIALGIARARELFRPRAVRPEAQLAPQSARSSFVLTLSQSADNLAVFASLYADARRALEPAIFLLTGACSIALCGAAVWLASHPLVQGPLRRISQRVLPVLLIAVGCHLLLNASTDEPHVSAFRGALGAESEPQAPRRVLSFAPSEENHDADVRCVAIRRPAGCDAAVGSAGTR